MIYFIQSGISGPIKIGYTKGIIEERLSALQTSSHERLHVIRTIDGDMELERELHEQFSECRIRGEWFKPEKELLEFINDSRAKDHKPIVDSEYHNYQRFGGFMHDLPCGSTVEALPSGEEILWFDI